MDEHGVRHAADCAEVCVLAVGVGAPGGEHIDGSLNAPWNAHHFGASECAGQKEVWRAALRYAYPHPGSIYVHCRRERRARWDQENVVHLHLGRAELHELAARWVPRREWADLNIYVLPIVGNGILELTPDQHRAAHACGFSFFPATEAQVQRLTMQKRIFWIGGHPVMVTRDGAFWETHGTLMCLIPEQSPGRPRVLTEAPELPPQPEQVTEGDPAPPVQVAVEPASTEADPAEEVASTQARKPRRRRAGAEVTRRRGGDNAAGGSMEMTAPEPAVADAPHVVEASGEVPVGAEDRSGSTVRRSRIRQPKEPRWATAGKDRRGRLK